MNRLLFKSRTHGLNKELGRRRGREGLFGEVIRDNSSYRSFDSLNHLEKTLGSELWEDDFGFLLSIHVVKEFLVDVWESRKGDNVPSACIAPLGGILVRIVSCGIVGMAGVVS